MTELIYMNDCYAKEFDAVVKKVDGKFIILDKTAFYPQGGGQPTDTGKLIKDGEEYKVVFAKKKGPEVSHEVDKEGLQAGDKVHGVIDWDNRHRLMRMHTAAHILCEIFHKETGALITGNQLNVDKSRIDFNLENFDREKMNEYVAKANEIVQKDLLIKIYTLPREEAMKIPSITKLANVLPPAVQELRIVEIVGFDTQADGGTHVKSTKEVGEIEIIGAENKGKNNRRVYYTLK
ncbi:alanyl-tRNA editing protein [Candidatus Woesearchaeota archaeon]|nr:alanyl-tRNA editing protein [Candidatus Woesearchaeota archaeon]MBW3005245.1 alanyl-tRNA editing protein [Candidatus Woesearchaeota archaeon]